MNIFCCVTAWTLSTHAQITRWRHYNAGITLKRRKLLYADKNVMYI